MRKNKLILMSGLAALVIATAGAAVAGRGPGGGPPNPDRMFERLDLNKDGEITREEAEGAREARFAETDTDGDGLISPAEMTAAREAKAAERQQRRFEKLDTNKDGLLSQEEMAESRRGQRHAGMFDRVDANDDGKITREEAEAMHQRMQERHGGRHGEQ
jgi:Ca2+-binding EF-hand superfamily protein